MSAVLELFVGLPQPLRVPPHQISHHFPQPVREDLIAASRTPLTVDDPLARVEAIDRAIARAKTQFPNLFRPKEIAS